MNAFSVIDARMTHLAENLRVTTENMANLHTSGYKARMGTPLRFGDMLSNMTLACTIPRHIRSGNGPGAFKAIEDKTGLPTLTGNTVSYPNELQKANQIGSWHGQMTRLIHANLDMLSAALKR